MDKVVYVHQQKNTDMFSLLIKQFRHRSGHKKNHPGKEERALIKTFLCPDGRLVSTIYPGFPVVIHLDSVSRQG
jgi:hypothetical protein